MSRNQNISNQFEDFIWQSNLKPISRRASREFVITLVGSCNLEGRNNYVMSDRLTTCKIFRRSRLPHQFSSLLSLLPSFLSGSLSTLHILSTCLETRSPSLPACCAACLPPPPASLLFASLLPKLADHGLPPASDSTLLVLSL